MKDKTNWLDLTMGFIIGIAVTVVLFAVLQAEAHTPCEEDYQPSRCNYIQVVNPITGNLEQQYVCE